MELFGTVALSLLLVAASIFWVFRNSVSQNAAPPLPPGPRGLPILGYLPFLKLNLHHQFTEIGLKYGPIYKLWLGSKLCVVISSPALIKQVVRDHDSVFANRDPPAAAIAVNVDTDIFFAPNGAYWRDIRKLFVREMLSNKSLQDSRALRVDEVRKFVRHLHTKIGEKIDIGELIFVTELRVMMALIWGGKIEGEERDRIGAEFRKKAKKFVDLLGKPNVSDFFPGLAKFDLQGVAREMKGVVPDIEELLDSVINERLKMMKMEKDDEKRKKDFLEILLELRDQKVGDTTFGLKIKTVLMDMIVGGTDTSAVTVEWVMSELLSNPAAMAKVQQELADVVGHHNVVEESHLSKLKYLDAVVKETLRLHPPLPLMVPRVPSESTTLAGYSIPKGTRVFLNAWAVSRDPQLWKGPSRFEPERFMDADVEYGGNNFEYIPFGSGRRVCPGLPLAQIMVMYLVATLLHSFEWRMEEGKVVDLSATFGIVMRKSAPLIAIPYKSLLDLKLYE